MSWRLTAGEAAQIGFPVPEGWYLVNGKGRSPEERINEWPEDGRDSAAAWGFGTGPTTLVLVDENTEELAKREGAMR